MWDYSVCLAVAVQDRSAPPLPLHSCRSRYHQRHRQLVCSWMLLAIAPDLVDFGPHRVVPVMSPRISGPREIQLSYAFCRWHRQLMCNKPEQKDSFRSEQ